VIAHLRVFPFSGLTLDPFTESNSWSMKYKNSDVPLASLKQLSGAKK